MTSSNQSTSSWWSRLWTALSFWKRPEQRKSSETSSATRPDARPAIREVYAFDKAADIPDWLMTRWPNFVKKDFASGRGRGPVMIHVRSADMLQELRNIVGPLTVNSSYRTPAYNTRVKGSPKSMHMRAMAFDLSLAGHNRQRLTDAAIRVGFKGIGQYDNFLHVDSRDYEGRWDERTASV